jgi:hypothetical protein
VLMSCGVEVMLVSLLVAEVHWSGNLVVLPPRIACLFLVARPKLTASIAYSAEHLLILKRAPSELCLSDNGGNDNQKIKHSKLPRIGFRIIAINSAPLFQMHQFNSPHHKLTAISEARSLTKINIPIAVFPVSMEALSFSSLKHQPWDMVML